MAVITPNSDLILLKVPLEIDEANQLTFANATAQYNYFKGLTGKLAVEKYTYQRKDGTIRFGANFDDIIGYNYVMYRNTSYSNKWFYAFIENMEYLGNNVTAVSIKTDPYQTWMFDLTYKPCLIDREHTNDDTVGKNTLPEEMELGDFVTNGNVTNFGASITGVGDWVIVVDVTMIENSTPAGSGGQTLNYTTDGGQTYGGAVPSQYVNGIPSGVYHLILGYNSSVVLSARDLVNVYQNAGLLDAIQAVYILPTALVGTVQTNITIGSLNPVTLESASCTVAMPRESSGVTSLTTNPATFTRPTTIDGYTPKNNKLLCYPYQYLNVSNNVGTTLPYRYEDFTSGAKFRIEGVLCPSGSTKAVPVDYKGISNTENGYDYSIQGAKYPMCSWSSDSYTNWLTQNGINMRAEWNSDLIAGAISSVAGIGGAMLSGGATTLAGALMGLGSGMSVGAGGIINQARQQHLARMNANLVPDQVRGNMNSADINWSKWRSQFTFLPMSIKAEYARCIDEFFSQFGYKCNRVKIPNITGRRNWNYVKTVGCYIDGDVPQADLQEIKSMFDKGVTFWHNASTFGDYSQNNDII